MHKVVIGYLHLYFLSQSFLLNFHVFVAEPIVEPISKILQDLKLTAYKQQVNHFYLYSVCFYMQYKISSLLYCISTGTCKLLDNIVKLVFNYRDGSNDVA